MACQPTDPCYNAACDDCNDLIEPCLEVCPTPVYTTVACLNPVDDKCVTITIPDNPCLNFTKPSKLDNLLNKIILSIKGLFSNITSSSLVITPVVGACSKTATIELVPSANAGNILTMGSDGLPYVPNVGGGGLTNIEIQDTNSINLSGGGTIQSPLNANVKLNPSVNNLIESTATGLLVEEVKINDIQRGLKQHIIFERPPINILSYAGFDDSGNPATISLSKVFINQGLNYATNFTANNPDVDLFWGDTVNYEKTLDNETGLGQSLSHDYNSLNPSSGEIELKTYNTSYFTELYLSTKNAGTLGFKFLKGADLITNVYISAAFTSSSAIMDFKNMRNVTALTIIPRYAGVNYSYTLKNTRDLESLLSADIRGKIAGSPDLSFINTEFQNLQLISSRGLRNVIVTNKTLLTFYADSASADTFDFTGSNLISFNLNNCGAAFTSFVNKVIFTLNPYTPTGAMFQFNTLKNINYYFTNGVKQDGTILESSYGTAVPTKFLMYDKTNGNNLDFVKINQDWVKDEVFISLDVNTLNKGTATFIQPNSIGLNFDAAYYNPIWSPLNGKMGLVYATQIGGVVTNIVSGGGEFSDGYGYSSLPQIVTNGSGSGLTTTVVMQLSKFRPITTAGTGYIIGSQYTFTGVGTIVNPIIIVTAINGSGGITSYDVVNKGEFTSLPTSITHVNGATLDTTNGFGFKRAIINNGGTGYTDSTIYKLEVTTNNGTGTGTASVQAKAAIENMHLKGWQMQW